jgi:acyl-CoA thioester hydrolase
MTSSPESRPSIPYGELLPVFVHHDDLDAFGMVHNSRYALIVERALSYFWEPKGYTFRNGRPCHPDASVGVAEFSVLYKLPIRNTGEVLVHLVVEHLGESSVVYAFRVLSPDGTLHAEGKRVHIHLDQQTLRPTPWAEETRAIYKTLQTQ